MGLVFHPGHEELHGITVVVRGSSGRTYVGRYHERTAHGLALQDVAVHDPAGGIDRETWLSRLTRFGIPVAHRRVDLPLSEIGTLSRLSEVVVSNTPS